MQNDSLTLISEERLNKLLIQERAFSIIAREMLMAKEVIDAARLEHNNECITSNCDVCLALRRYDEVCK